MILFLFLILYTYLINTMFLFGGNVSFLVLFTEQLQYELRLFSLNTEKNEEFVLKAQIGRIIDLHCIAKQLNKRIGTLDINSCLNVFFIFFFRQICCRILKFLPTSYHWLFYMEHKQHFNFSSTTAYCKFIF